MSWRKIYREILKTDIKKEGKITCAKFMQLLHQNDCFLSREEYLGLFKKFGSGPKFSSGEPDLNDFESIYISD